VPQHHAPFGSGAGTSEAQIVYVLDAAKQVAVHTLTNATHAFCACTCETAVQRKTCVHQAYVQFNGERSFLHQHCKLGR
jgi:hypothetical protein